MVTNCRSGCPARLSIVQSGKGFPIVRQELVGPCSGSSAYVSKFKLLMYTADDIG